MGTSRDPEDSDEKRRRRAAYGKGPLSRPSMPGFPVWASQNRLAKWSKAKRAMEQKGFALLIKHYFKDVLDRRRIASLGAEEKLWAVFLALAADNVPFFRVKKPKSTVANWQVLARLLNDYQQEISNGHSRVKARSLAARKLPGKLAHASDKRIENMLSKARTGFRHTVDVLQDGSVVPKSEFAARIWRYHLDGSVGSVSEAHIEPVPDDPGAIQVTW